MPKRVSASAASAARTTNGVGNPHNVLGATVSLCVNVTAVSGTPNLVAGVEWSNDLVNWFTADPDDVMTAVTTTGAKTKTFTAKAIYCRAKWTITGTTPSLTFTADIFSVN